MSFVDLFGSGEHLRNLGHFAAIVNLAAIDGEINAKEEIHLQRFARSVDIFSGHLSFEDYRYLLNKD